MEIWEWIGVIALIVPFEIVLGIFIGKCIGGIGNGKETDENTQ